jgi:hypothetical protein
MRMTHAAVRGRSGFEERLPTPFSLARRYDTAYALARDLERSLRDEPVEAGPLGRATDYQVRSRWQPVPPAQLAFRFS